MMTKTVPNLMTDIDPQIQSTLQILGIIKLNKTIPRHIIVNCLQLKTEKNLQATTGGQKGQLPSKMHNKGHLDDSVS